MADKSDWELVSTSSEHQEARHHSMQSPAAGASPDLRDGTSRDLDWIEPASPFRTCAISTDEDDDSPSRSHSDGSMEGAEWQSPDTSLIAEAYFTEPGHSASSRSQKQDAKIKASFEKEDFAAVPIEHRREPSNMEAGQVAGDESPTSNERGKATRWMRRLGAWLAVPGRASTLWSTALAATCVGLLLLGNRWQRVGSQYRKLRLPFFSNGTLLLCGAKPSATLVSWSRGFESYAFSNFLL